MELATDETVLGDFNDAEFTRHGETTRFFRDGKKFMVNAEGPDGEYHDYEVKYTFGVRPLQQYMVEFPDGRVQVLRVSWDVRQEGVVLRGAARCGGRADRGRRPAALDRAGRTGTRCAPSAIRPTITRTTTWRRTRTTRSIFEIDVSCEECHGPGSVHVELAESRSLFWDRNVDYGLTNS